LLFYRKALLPPPVFAFLEILKEFWQQTSPKF